MKKKAVTTLSCGLESRSGLSGADRLRWRRKRWDDSAYTYTDSNSDTYTDTHTDPNSNTHPNPDTYAHTGCPDFYQGI
jgi:hypothetical protein